MGHSANDTRMYLFSRRCRIRTRRLSLEKRKRDSPEHLSFRPLHLVLFTTFAILSSISFLAGIIADFSVRVVFMGSGCIYGISNASDCTDCNFIYESDDKNSSDLDFDFFPKQTVERNFMEVFGSSDSDS